MKTLTHCRIAVLALLCLTCCLGYAQDEPNVNAFISVDQEPKTLNMRDVQMKIGYPQVARDAGIEGTVVLRILVGNEGQYIRHVVLNSVHPALEGAVVQNISKISFTPAEKDGKPVKFWVNLPFTFKLIGGKKEVPEGIQVLEDNSPKTGMSPGPIGSGKLILFPNPSTGKLELSFIHSYPGLELNRYRFWISRENGYLRNRMFFEGKQWTYLLNLPELSAGTYSCAVATEKKRFGARNG